MSKYGGQPAELRITGSGLPGGTKVELDGQDVSRGLTGITFRLGLEVRPTAVLDLVLGGLDTAVENPKLILPGATRELLIQLGWTPPEGDGAS